MRYSCLLRAIRLLLGCLLLASPSVWALTEAQLATLKTDITVTHAADFADELAVNNYQAIADYYNALASPQVLLWRPNVSVDEIKPAIDWVAYMALDEAHRSGYIAMTQGGRIDTTAPLIQKGFADIFGAGSATATNLAGIVKRAGSNLEVLFSTAGAQQTRVSQVYGQLITDQDVLAALRLP